MAFENFNNLAEKLFDRFSDAVQTCSIFTVSNTPNPATGTNSETENVLASGIQLLPLNYERKQDDGIVLPGDLLGKVRASQVTSVIPPNAILKVGATEYTILDEMKKPVNNPVIREFHLREKK